MAINGNHIIYHYLQKQLRQSDIWLFQMLVTRMIADLAVWFSPSLYLRMPILLPHVIRDSSCRPRKKGGKDEWGYPDQYGYCRDDNSLVKSLPKSLNISSPANPLYQSERLGNGFVASHIWRSADLGLERQRMGWTNSFIPNLVWLPSQLSRLTDHAGSFTQAYLQAISYKIYRDIPFNENLQPFVSRAWEQLPEPNSIPQQGLPRSDELSFFDETDSFVKRRVETIKRVRDQFISLKNPRANDSKLKPRKYASGLAEKSWIEVEELYNNISSYLASIA